MSGTKFFIRNKKRVTTQDVKNQLLDLMPGFKFSWYYLGIELHPDNKYSNTKDTKPFVR